MPNYAAILDAIRANPRYRQNLDWGEPRQGHPEGTIRAHIEELERNLDRLRHKLSDEQAAKLRLLIHTHDTFKPDAIEKVRITHVQSHASLATQFLGEFVGDEDLLRAVQFHDEPCALWHRATSRTRPNLARFNDLLAVIRDWDVFLAFLIIDGCTAGKSREPLRWFFREIEGKVATKFSAGDIL